MKSASKSVLYRFSAIPVLPAITVAIVMIAFLALGALSYKASAKALGGGTFHGVTSQGMPARIEVSGSGRTIREASIPMSLKCSFGAPLFLPQKLRAVPITPQGRFKATVDDSTVDEGVSIHVFESFSGSFNRRRTSVRTRSRIYVSVHNPDGSVDKCDSGVVRLRARR